MRISDWSSDVCSSDLRLAVDRLDGGDRAAGDVADRGDARARGDAVHMHGASTAHRHATAEFGAGQPELVADDPEQRRVLGHVAITFLAIDLKLHHVSHSLLRGGFKWWSSP